MARRKKKKKGQQPEAPPIEYRSGPSHPSLIENVTARVLAARKKWLDPRQMTRRDWDANARSLRGASLCFKERGTL